LVATTLDVPVSEFFAGAAETNRASFATKSVAFDPQAFRIAEAFVKIADKELRASLIDLVEAMARKSAYRTWRGAADARVPGSSGFYVSGLNFQVFGFPKWGLGTAGVADIDARSPGSRIGCRGLNARDWFHRFYRICCRIRSIGRRKTLKNRWA
jgi:hypothetical protein